MERRKERKLGRIGRRREWLGENRDKKEGWKRVNREEGGGSS